MSEKITASDLQEMQDMIDGKSLLSDDELLHWMRKDLQRLVTAYFATPTAQPATATQADGDARVLQDELKMFVKIGKQFDDLYVEVQRLRADLAAEREAHERTRQAHLIIEGRNSDRLNAEREGADGLAESYLLDMEFIHDNKLNHEGLFADCENGVCTQAAKVLAAHDARRKADGGGA